VSEQMWAAVIERHGGPENVVYRQIARPEPGPGDVLLKVRYCGLNALDFFVRRGVPGIHVSLPHISGGDVVGEVVAGDIASEHLPGSMYLVDPLIDGAALGEDRPGGMAEYVTVPAANLIPLPQQDPRPERYAALPIAYGTAHRMLFTRARLGPGETVAILGAAGGVGVACVQLARHIGATVIACSSSAAKLRRLQELGAHYVVNTAQTDFSAEIWRLTAKRGADVVVDYIGKDTLAASVRATKAGGRIAICGASSGAEATIDLRYLWVREINLVGSDGWRRSDLDKLVGMVSRGELDPVIDCMYPLERAREAMEVLEERRCFGKVLVAAKGLSDGQSNASSDL
jgi:alcohol dehydrogenase